MSADTVDDLHAAEEYGSAIREAARAVVDYWINEADWPMAKSSWTALDDIGETLTKLISALDIASRTRFCRPSCEDGCDDDCGCSAHGDSEYPHYPCPDDPDGLHHSGCGCE